MRDTALALERVQEAYREAHWLLDTPLLTDDALAVHLSALYTDLGHALRALDSSGAEALGLPDGAPPTA